MNEPIVPMPPLFPGSNPVPPQQPSPPVITQKHASSGLKKILKTIVIFLVLIIASIGGYFVLDQYFPQYAGFVKPYVGPVLDPILSVIELSPEVSDPNLNQPQATATTSPLPMPTISPTASPEQFNIPADWKTYRNVEYAFEVKYPGEYGEKNAEASEWVVVSFTQDQKPLDIFIWASKLPFNDVIGNKIKNDVVIDGQRGVEVKSGSNNENIDLILEYKDKNYKINYLGINDNNANLIAYRQILSTFKFLPDADGDGLPNEDEMKYGTNPANPDTDGDTWPDGEEVQHGYNPLGPGRK